MPAPPDGEAWCQACAMFTKHKVNAAFDTLIKDLLADGKDEGHVIRPDRALTRQLQVAVVRGICGELQPFGMLELCWYHLGGVSIETGSPLAQGGIIMPPGLKRGRG